MNFHSFHIKYKLECMNPEIVLWSTDLQLNAAKKNVLRIFISQTKSSCKLMCAQIDIHVHTKTFLFSTTTYFVEIAIRPLLNL